MNPFHAIPNRARQIPRKAWVSLGLPFDVPMMNEGKLNSVDHMAQSSIGINNGPLYDRLTSILLIGMETC
jgi:hypothetical protein